MQNQDERTNPSNQQDHLAGNIVGNIKTLFLFIGGIALVLSILVLLPMFLTYLSEGDYRAPSEVHPTDSAKKNNQNNYNPVGPNQ